MIACHVAYNTSHSGKKGDEIMRIGCRDMHAKLPAALHVARLSITTTLMVTFMVSSGFGEDWPQFRGINSTGVSTSNKSLPTKFSVNENVLWSVELGEGIASPIISGGRVFATALAVLMLEQPYRHRQLSKRR